MITDGFLSFRGRVQLVSLSTCVWLDRLLSDCLSAVAQLADTVWTSSSMKAAKEFWMNFKGITVTELVCSTRVSLSAAFQTFALSVLIKWKTLRLSCSFHSIFYWDFTLLTCVLLFWGEFLGLAALSCLTSSSTSLLLCTRLHINFQSVYSHVYCNYGFNNHLLEEIEEETETSFWCPRWLLNSLFCATKSPKHKDILFTIKQVKALRGWSQR